MEQFKHLKLPDIKRASSGKSHVKPAATKFKSTWSKLSRLDRFVLYGVALWVLLMILMLINSTESDSIRIDYIEPDVNIDSERLA